jgi:hypothetical protein
VEDAAKCAVHPEVNAEAGTCGRCGAYMCAACASEMRNGKLCKSCEAVLLERGMIRHVPKLAVAVGSYGVLLLVVSFFYCGFLGLAGVGMSDPSYAFGDDDYLGLGVFALAAAPEIPAAILHIAAGAALRRRRGRILTYVAVVSGFFAIGAACFFPLSIALLVYAGLVLGDVDVREMFDAEEESE